jgi:hypothetical protein
MYQDERVVQLKELIDSAPATPEDEWQREFTDEEVHLIRHEKAFDEAFGKHLDYPERDRIALIRLQKEFDLTQKRIKALGHSGRIKREKNGIAIKGTGLWATIGLCFWSWLLPFAVLTVLWLDSQLKQLELMNSTNFTMIILTSVLSILAWLAVFWVGTFFIRPWVLEKQTLKANGLPWNTKIQGPR